MIVNFVSSVVKSRGTLTDKHRECGHTPENRSLLALSGRSRFAFWDSPKPFIKEEAI